MIVRDEEAVLARCLASVREAVDEIIVVDTGSADRTKTIACENGALVFDYPWNDDFSAARNFSFQQATMDYILWLDADDVLEQTAKEALCSLKETLSFDVDAVMMPYDTGFDPEGKAVFSCFRERLMKRERHFLWEEPVHECLILSGNVIFSDIHITHRKEKVRDSNRNLAIYEHLLQKGRSLSPRGTYYYARELMEHSRFAEAIRQFHLFLETKQGFAEDNIGACLCLGDCLKALGEQEKVMPVLLQSFLYDTPRAEACCRIGYSFLEQQKYREAVFWFSLVFSLKKPAVSIGFREEECWGYLPNIECAVCYDRLGEYGLAERYNDKAAAFHPNAPEVLQNREYFKRRNAL